jgi:hypothetical protein
LNKGRKSMFDDQRERQKKAKFHEHMAAERAKLDRLSEALERGTATGQPMAREDIDKVREAVAISKRRYPAGTQFDAQGNAWTRGFGGAMVPAMPNLPDQLDFENEQRAERRFSKKAQRLHTRMRATYPDLDDNALRTAASNLISNSGMSLDQISDLAEDDPETLMEAVASASSIIGLMRDEQQQQTNQQRTAGIPGGSGSGRGGNVNVEDKPTSMLDDIKSWQDKTGYGRG